MSPHRLRPAGSGWHAPSRERSANVPAVGVVSCGKFSDTVVLVLRPGDNHGCRATQMIQAKAQCAGNGRSPFQGLQRRIGSSGPLPKGEPGPSIRRMLAAWGAGACSLLQAPWNEPGSARPRRCASWQGRRPLPARRALRPTASQFAASVIITWTEY